MSWKDSLARAVAAGDADAKRTQRAMTSRKSNLDARLARLEERTRAGKSATSPKGELTFAKSFAELEKTAIAGDAEALQELRDQANGEDSPTALRARAALAKMREPRSDRVAKDPEMRLALGFRATPQPTRPNVHAIPLMTPSQARAFRAKRGYQ
jgi:hypothetical protein